MLLISKNWLDLIKPSELKINESSPTQTEIIVEPLERGFGITLGNALRRILLSSLQGAAITSVKIEGILHEFSSIPGVKEDMVDVILNVKSLRLRMNSAEKKRLTLNVVGPCVVTAGMIETGHDVEILNPDLVLFHLDKGNSVNMELICETGRGYVPATHMESDNANIGVINVDAIFTPVIKVSYKVENSRVGQVTDYDKLKLSVETDGSMSPEMAVALAARILQDQFKLFITFEEIKEDKEKQEVMLPFDANLLKKVDELELSVRSQNCLKNDNIVYIGDLVLKSEGEMLKTPNFGRKSLNEIRDLLSTMNLKFGMTVEGWPPENIEDLAKKYEDPF